MRPRHVKLRQDARGHDGEGEECGDHRRPDTDTCESDFTANARGSRRGSAKVREPGRCAITRRRSCRAGGAIDFRCADRPLRGARRGYGRGHLRERRTSGDDGAPPCRETPNPESSTLPSVARPSGTSPDPRLCVPASRQVCRYREGVSVRRQDVRQAPSQIWAAKRVRAELMVPWGLRRGADRVTNRTATTKISVRRHLDITETTG